MDEELVVRGEVFVVYDEYPHEGQAIRAAFPTVEGAASYFVKARRELSWSRLHVHMARYVGDVGEVLLSPCFHIIGRSPIGRGNVFCDELRGHDGPHRSVIDEERVARKSGNK